MEGRDGGVGVAVHKVVDRDLSQVGERRKPRSNPAHAFEEAGLGSGPGRGGGEEQEDERSRVGEDEHACGEPVEQGPPPHPENERQHHGHCGMDASHAHEQRVVPVLAASPQALLEHR